MASYAVCSFVCQIGNLSTDVWETTDTTRNATLTLDVCYTQKQLNLRPHPTRDPVIMMVICRRHRLRLTSQNTTALQYVRPTFCYNFVWDPE